MANITSRTVGSTTLEYDSMTRLWKRSRAILGGELAAKAHDSQLDLVNYNNLLIPFSSQMLPEQYAWYVGEAELPGLTSQYAKILLGGLLRKEPSIVLPEDAPEEAEAWLRDNFSREGGSLVAFLDAVISEELITYATAISVDYPEVDNYDQLSTEERASLFPYPVFWKAEDIINRQVGIDPRTGKEVLTRVVFRYFERDYEENTHHPLYQETLADYHLVDGQCVVDYYQKEKTDNVSVEQGSVTAGQMGFIVGGDTDDWRKTKTVVPKKYGEPLTRLPVFFTNGAHEYQVPILTPLIDREVALYNKVSRRNHLLLGAATYTPVIMSDMSEEDFQGIVRRGLGSWIKLSPDDKVDVLATPTDALTDMDRAIEASIAEMSRLGLRILAPDGTSADSGIALEIRNSSQTAQLAVINNRISNTLKQVIQLMLSWKYGDDFDWSEVEFTLSADFNPAPLGKEWMTLVTEWYEARIIPRSSFIKMAKLHDLLPPDYDDDEGREEIGTDDLISETIEPVTIEE